MTTEKNGDDGRDWGYDDRLEEVRDIAGSMPACEISHPLYWAVEEIECLRKVVELCKRAMKQAPSFCKPTEQTKDHLKKALNAIDELNP